MSSLSTRLIFGLESSYLKRSIRSCSSFKTQNECKTEEIPSVMSGWQINGYNGLQSLKLIKTLTVPPLSRPNDVLVEIKAASVNVLDVMMTDGYGQKFFEKFYELEPSQIKTLKSSLLPFTPGRDFAGVVQATGEGVKQLKPGDEVMGVVSPPHPGSHAQYVVTSACNMVKKPENLTMEEAASLPYSGLTAWSALSLTAELCIGSKGKKVLVLGAAGGVGSIAVQLLKNWGTTVVSTGTPQAVQQLLELGSDFVVDYTSPEAEVELQQFCGFDVILDCTGRTEGFPYFLLKPWSNSKYVTLSPPTLRNFDEHGLVGGMIKSGIDLLAANSSAILEGKTLRWGYFVPSSSALRKMVDLARDKKLRAVIDSVFSYEALPEAYAKMKEGHKRGKVIVKM